MFCDEKSAMRSFRGLRMNIVKNWHSCNELLTTKVECVPGKTRENNKNRTTNKDTSDRLHDRVCFSTETHVRRGQ